METPNDRAGHPVSQHARTCGHCQGTGEYFTPFAMRRDGHCEPATLKCYVCHGTGNDTTDPAWRGIGSAARAARVARGESLGEAARRLGITAAQLSGMERGTADPSRLVAG